MVTDYPGTVIDRRRYDLVRSKVGAVSTRELTKYVTEVLGLRPPTDDYRWTVNRMTVDGVRRVGWSAAWRVVIDPVGFGWPYPDQSMEIDPELRERLREETAHMRYASEVAAHVIAAGVAPPDDSGDWEVYREHMPGRDDGEQLIWYRTARVPIVPDDETSDADD